MTIIVLLHVSNHKRRKDKQKRYRELSPDISPVKAGFFQSLHDDYNPKGVKNKNVLTIDIDFEGMIIYIGLVEYCILRNLYDFIIWKIFMENLWQKFKKSHL